MTRLVMGALVLALASAACSGTECDSTYNKYVECTGTTPDPSYTTTTTCSPVEACISNCWNSASCADWQKEMSGDHNNAIAQCLKTSACDSQ